MMSMVSTQGTLHGKYAFNEVVSMYIYTYLDHRLLMNMVSLNVIIIKTEMERKKNGAHDYLSVKLLILSFPFEICSNFEYE